MKYGTWIAAFTITVDGQQIDLSELSEASRGEIARCVAMGLTEGTVREDGLSAKSA